MCKNNYIKPQTTQEEIMKLDNIFDEKITDWIQDYNSFKNKYDKDIIMKKTKIIAKHRNDNSLVERIKQRMGS